MAAGISCLSFSVIAFRQSALGSLGVTIQAWPGRAVAAAEKSQVFAGSAVRAPDDMVKKGRVLSGQPFRICKKHREI
jgi:hypothetical protein